ncbi:signal peptide peptidase-like 2B [Haemaphysalis longicornis]
MVEVATAGGSKEQMPMVVRVPRFGNSILAACHHDYSLLGFGDILIPGFLVAYLRGFDLIIVDGCFYFPIVVIFYGLGLLTTFVVLHVTRLGQPALLYLVPFTMLPTVGLAYFRGELALLWHGMQRRWFFERG